ncbi:MAG: lytic transglycosylase domain-containing protein [Longimicrobiales bacterium]
MARNREDDGVCPQPHDHWVHDARANSNHVAASRPRRRASDSAGVSASSTHSPTGAERRRAALRRLRKPLIGLGMLGAAMPMSQAVENAEPPPLSPLEEEKKVRTRCPPKQDVEEEMASEIGQLRADGERNNHVINAVQRYGISRAMAQDIYDVAQEEGIDPNVAFGLVRTESTFKENAVSNVGARGLTQVMPRTAKWLIPGTTAQDLHDRRTNLRLGFRYLDQLIDKYRGNLPLALTAYNRGPGTVDRVIARGGDPDNGYAGKVLKP